MSPEYEHLVILSTINIVACCVFDENFTDICK